MILAKESREHQIRRALQSSSGSLSHLVPFTWMLCPVLSLSLHSAQLIPQGLSGPLFPALGA